MTAEFLIRFLGGGALFGLAGAILFLALGAPTIGRDAALRGFPVVFLALLFLALTQHPLPDPAALRCPVASAAPQLRPFEFVEGMASRWARGGFPALFEDRHAPATAMNFLLPFAIGASFARASGRPAAALALGAALTLVAETSQLTGLWGLYPCAWRRFNVDDLMLNLAGVALGHLAALRLIQRWRRAPRGG